MSIDVRVMEYSGKAARVIEKMAAITGRTVEEAEGDLHRMYLWVLHEQAAGRKIFSIDGNTGGRREFENLVKSQEEAEEFFKEIGWPLV